MSAKQHILIAPLDWGLGHTTRCIPVIRFLRQLGHEVFVAAEGASAQLLKENFADITILPLSGYNIRYARTKSGFIFKILQQLPKIVRKIRWEHQWLQQIISEHKIDAVIADNRYGLFSSKIKNVILTHQVQILSGRGKISDAILLAWHRRMLERFGECWIVDEPLAPGLSGKLAHPKRLPKNAKYIGWLSQFEHMEIQEGTGTKGHFLVLLSGPEPMRTQLERILWRQCTKLTGYSFCFVAGRPGTRAPEPVPEHMQWHGHLSAGALSEEILRAHGIICRGGYTTLMDLQTLRRPALLIPTPGQTEQDYLAKQLSDTNRNFIYAPQESIDLKSELAKMLYLDPNSEQEPYQPFFKHVISNWLRS